MNTRIIAASLFGVALLSGCAPLTGEAQNPNVLANIANPFPAQTPGPDNVVGSANWNIPLNPTPPPGY